MKHLALCSVVLLALAAFGAPVLAADSGDSGSDVALTDLLQVEPSQSPVETPFDTTSSLETRNKCSGGGATCECSGTCEADSSGCSCT